MSGKIMSERTENDRVVMERMREENRMKNGNEIKNTAHGRDSEFERLPEKTKSISYLKLFKYATKRELLLVYIGVAFGVLSGVFMPLIIMIYGEYTTLLVDRHTPNKTISPTKLLPLFGGGRETDGTETDRRKAIVEDASAFGFEFAILALLQFLVSFVTVSTLNYSAVLQGIRLRRALLRAVLRQEISWFDCNNLSSFPSKVVEDVNRVQEGIGEKLGIFTHLLMNFLLSVTMAFLHGWKLTLVMLTCAPVLIASNAIVSKMQTGLATQEMEAYGKAGGVAEEVFSSIKTVMAFSGQEKEIQRYHKALRRSLKMGIKRGLLTGLGSGVMWFITYACYALAFWYGVSLIIQSKEEGDFEYTPAVLIIIFFGVLAGAITLGQSSPHLEAFSVARGAATSIFSVLERDSQIDPITKEGKILGRVKGEIEFQNIHFEYPSRPEVKVLNGLNLHVKEGELVALVGASGCGKSTILQLVQRLYDPGQGSIQLDGVNLKDLNVKFLREQIGVVGQEPSLFATTIYENIRYGLETATKEQIVQAARVACAHDFIMKLPMKYETVLGARGSLISGGQKQRIAIARALLRNPRILLLDEATSALDAANESRVQEALNKASKGRTTVVVTHKLAGITNADRIVVISEGRVVEEGTHQELIALKGHYYKLLEIQKRNEEDILQIQAYQNVEDENGDSFTSVNLKEFYLGGDDEDNADHATPTTVLEIIKYNRPEWCCLVIAALCTFVVGAGTPVLAVLFGELYGVLSEVNSAVVSATTAYYSGLLFGLGIITGMATFVQLYLFNYAGVRLTFRLRQLVFSAILSQEAGWFDEERHRPGVLCARLSSNAADIQGATGSRISVIIQSFSTIALGVIVGLIYSWKMTLITLTGAPVIFCGLYFEGKIIQGRSLLERKALEGATKVSVEAIRNIRTVASLGIELNFINQYDKALRSSEKGMKVKSGVRGAVYGLGSSAPYFSYALSLWYGGILVSQGDLHYKDLIKVSEAVLFGMWVLGQSLAFAPNFSQAKISAARLFYILKRVPTLRDGDIKDRDWKAEGKVEFSNVEFAYPTRPEMNILRGLTLNIEKGKSIALVGPSGCGKSTAIQLLLRLYDPTKGTVYLDGLNLKSLQIIALRRQMGIVSQEPVLFDKTIAENIAYGDNSRTLTQEEISRAAKSANIHDFIISLPLGYETKVGAGGAQLSGGQKQRIAIARALVKNPKILLLDEATSALDAESEAIVQGALDSAAAGRTTITVGHRMGSIKNADVILFLDKGQVRKAGKFEQLFGHIPPPPPSNSPSVATPSIATPSTATPSTKPTTPKF